LATAALHFAKLTAGIISHHIVFKIDALLAYCVGSFNDRVSCVHCWLQYFNWQLDAQYRCI